MNKAGQQVHLIWSDAKLFHPNNRHVELSIMETTGVLLLETKEFVIIKDPVTINIKTKKKHPDGKDPTFYYIPKGMIRKMNDEEFRAF